MGRLKADVDRRQAEAELNVLYRPILDEGSTRIDDPKWREAFKRQHIALTPGGRGDSDLRANFSEPLGILMGVVGIVLLIACANIANLMLARGAARQREISVRMAIGAARSRLIRQLLTESLLLAGIGGAAGLLAANWGNTALIGLVSTRSSRTILDTSTDVTVLVFTVAVALLTGVFFGLAPAFGATRISLTPSLNDRSTTAGSRSKFAKTLVSAQIMLTLLLLIGAGLLVHSLVSLQSRDFGFDRVGVLQVSWKALSTGDKKERLAGLFDAVQQKVSSLPGVLSASLSSTGLLTGTISVGSINAEGASEQPDDNVICYFDKVSTNFFETVGMPVIKGRPFGPQDVAGAPKVAVISQTAARLYFGENDPIGRRFHKNFKDKELIEVVGIAKDAKYLDVRNNADAMVYTPYLQDEEFGALGLGALEVRTVGDQSQLAAAIRNEIYSIDQTLAINSILPLGELAGESLVHERAIATLASFFGLLALLLASIGLYGVMSYSVNRRTAEVGIRLALGATPSAVQWLIVRETLLLLATGGSGGLLAAFALTRLLSGLLYGLPAMDPAALVVATLVLVAAVALAGYLPARRAARVDPMTALRCE
jgi:predicted permease